MYLQSDQMNNNETKHRTGELKTAHNIVRLWAVFSSPVHAMPPPEHVCNGLACSVDESKLTWDIEKTTTCAANSPNAEA